MARVHHVKKGRKERRCRKCGKPIEAGQPYQWTQLYRAPKKYVHPTCGFRRSDLTGSDKLGRVYDAVDDAESNIGNWSPDDGDNGTEGLSDILNEAAEQIREVAEEYQESADNIRDSFSESPTADECEERAEELESFADELENADLEDYEEDDENTDEEKEQARDEWADEQRSAALEALENCPV